MGILPKKQVTKALKVWWIHLLVALTLIIGGISIINLQDNNFFNLSTTLSIYCLLTGGGHIYFGVANRKIFSEWSWHLASGVFDCFLAFTIFTVALTMADILPVLTGIWATSKCATYLGVSFDLKLYGVRKWNFYLSLAVIFGLIGLALILSPIFILVSSIALTYCFLILIGLVLAILSFQFRNLHEIPQKIISRVTSTL